MKAQVLALAIATAAAFVGCSTTQPTEPHPEPTAASEQARQCPEDRAEICPQIFRPVCGSRDTGIRCVTTPCNSTEQANYPNGCAACAEPRVISYTEGQCGSNPPAIQRFEAE